MSAKKSDQQSASPSPPRKKKDRAAEIADTFEWLITAFILAFVFRAFVMEAFRIPTGSMADTLKGAHFRMRCVQCGHRYEHGFIPGDYTNSQGNRLREDTVPAGGVTPPRTRCPSCGNYPATSDKVPVANGDRILVLKCIYQFFEPKRWDVIVFKNPDEPHVNYIKRLVAVPGDTLEIIDGDVYIDGQISRKPPRVQEELWMPVYNNDYRPVDPNKPTFSLNRSKGWEQPFKNKTSSNWLMGDVERPTQFRLDSPTDRVHTMFYDSSQGNNFRATYAYNRVDSYRHMPVCSDLMVRFYVAPTEHFGQIGATLTKYGIAYSAWVDQTGRMVVTKQDGDVTRILAEEQIGPLSTERWTGVKFANIDHQLVFDVGDETLVHDLGRDPNAAGAVPARPVGRRLQPQVEVFGAGKLTLAHIAIFRDIHYTSGRGGGGDRAVNGKPFKLEDDEFFVLGDNSPNSQDSRWWTRAGKSNRGGPYYRPGIVPRDYLVGKALFVYWPSGFKPFKKFPVAAIPNVGQMRFIYGGE